MKVDVRILAATNINIPEALATKRLREDLYYRLNAFTLQYSATARAQGRNSDPAQAFHVAHVGALCAAAAAAVCRPDGRVPRYSWPGNLRELSNFVKRYLILGDEKLASQELHPKNDGSGGRTCDAARAGGAMRAD